MINIIIITASWYAKVCCLYHTTERVSLVPVWTNVVANGRLYSTFIFPFLFPKQNKKIQSQVTKMIKVKCISGVINLIES